MCPMHDVQAKEIETRDRTTELIGTQVPKCVYIRYLLNYFLQLSKLSFESTCSQCLHGMAADVMSF